MLIKIISIAQIDKAISVGFKTMYGCAQGIWESNVLPEEGKSYSTEFDIENEMAWNDNVKLSMSNALTIAKTLDYTFVVNGVLESIDEDDYSVIRMGNKIITCFIKEIPREYIGRHITLSVKKMSLYPDIGMPVVDLDEE
jgi:hypothetical protein